MRLNELEERIAVLEEKERQSVVTYAEIKKATSRYRTEFLTSLQKLSQLRKFG